MKLAIALLAALLGACATAPPPPPPEIRTTLVPAPYPVPVPCFTEDERPVLAPRIDLDPDDMTITPEQLIAAKLANALALSDYATKIDALFMRCTKPIGGTL